MASDAHDEANLYAKLEYCCKRHLELESQVKSLRDEEKRLRKEKEWLESALQAWKDLDAQKQL
ncbi:MAG: hypothetical protein QXX64_05860 [Nitrososphaera sp.]